MLDDEQKRILDELIAKSRDRKTERFEYLEPFNIGHLYRYFIVFGVFIVICSCGFAIGYAIYNHFFDRIWQAFLFFTFFSVLLVLSTWFFIRVIKAIIAGPTTVTGVVRKRVLNNVYVIGVPLPIFIERYETFHQLSVGGKIFNVSEGMYRWVEKNEELIVYYWPFSNAIYKISKTGKRRSTEVNKDQKKRVW